MQELQQERRDAHKKLRQTLGSDNFEQTYLQAQNDDIQKNLKSLRDFYDERVGPLAMDNLFIQYRKNYGNLAEMEINDKLSSMYIQMIKNLERQLKNLKKNPGLSHLAIYLESTRFLFEDEYRKYFVNWKQPVSSVPRKRRR